MKAWVVVSNAAAPAKALALRADAPDAPAPTGADVRVRVTHAALNPADLHFMKILPTWLPFRRNATPGLDFAGEVVALGPQASAAPAHAAAPLTVGARVCGCMSVRLVATGHGALAEYVTVPAELLARTPAALDAEHAVGLLGIAGQTAHLVLTDPRAEAVWRAAGSAEGAGSADKSSAATTATGPHLLIHGASGGVGTLLVQAAKTRGAHVTAVCSAANAEFVRGLGADDVIDYRAHDPLSAYLAETYHTAPFDLIVDCVGDNALFTHSVPYLAGHGAVLSIVGGATQGVLPFVRNKLVPTLLGGTPRAYGILGLAPSGAQARAVAAWVAEGRLTAAPIDSVYSMADVVQAYEKLATKHARGKIVIKVQD